MDPSHILDGLALLYAISLPPILAASFAMLGVAALGLFKNGVEHPAHQGDDQKSDEQRQEWPFVTVQIPVFDDPVAVRCVEACLAFDYPADRFEIMILDDSKSEIARALLSDLAARHPKRIVYRHRTHREGYKPGALVAAMPHVHGELIALFDADFVPDPSMLTELVNPFLRDPRMGIVQGRQGFLNENRNLVTRFASCLLSVQHHVVLPVAARFGVVFFCGTAGMLRRSAIEDAGGWNTDSITEDADLSVRMIARGWQTVYLPMETPSEVPSTLGAFLRQQMRWCFGGLRVFIDHAAIIMRSNRDRERDREQESSPKLRLAQRLFIAYLTLGNLVALPVALMTAVGIASWLVVGLAAMNDGGCAASLGAAGLDGRIGVMCTLSFIVVAALALHRRGKLARSLPWLVVGACSITVALSFANAVAVLRALFFAKKPLFNGGKEKTSWICTPKIGNAHYVDGPV